MPAQFKYANPSTDTIQALNDAFRTTFKGGSVMMTAGVVALGAEVQQKRSA